MTWHFQNCIHEILWYSACSHLVHAILLSQPYNPAGVKFLLCSHLLLDHLMCLLTSGFIVAQYWSASPSPACLDATDLCHSHDSAWLMASCTLHFIPVLTSVSAEETLVSVKSLYSSSSLAYCSSLFCCRILQGAVKDLVQGLDWILSDWRGLDASSVSSVTELVRCFPLPHNHDLDYFGFKLSDPRWWCSRPWRISLHPGTDVHLTGRSFMNALMGGWTR